MIDGRGLDFSPTLAKQRQEGAVKVFGESSLKRVVGLALFFLGEKRAAIAEVLSMRPESVKTFIKNVHKDGLPAIEDRRQSRSSFLPSSAFEPVPVQVTVGAHEVIINFGAGTRSLKIPSCNVIELRTVVLSLKRSGLLSARQAAYALGLSEQRIGQLARKLDEADAPGLVDKRQGQQQSYVVDEKVKHELVLQCAANAVTGRPTSSEALVRDIHERCAIALSPRSVRHHARKLGLVELATTLPELVETAKKKGSC